MDAGLAHQQQLEHQQWLESDQFVDWLNDWLMEISQNNELNPVDLINEIEDNSLVAIEKGLDNV